MYKLSLYTRKSIIRAHIQSRVGIHSNLNSHSTFLTKRTGVVAREKTNEHFECNKKTINCHFCAIIKKISENTEKCTRTQDLEFSI